MRASDKVYAQLVSQIQTGALSPGTVLVEAEQAQRLNVSRTPIREAISRLVADGLATQQSPRTTVVSGFDRDDIIRLFEARRVLEEAAVRLAAQRGAREIFASIAESFSIARSGSAVTDSQSYADDAEVTDIDNYFELIARLDLEIDVAVGNPYIVSALRVIRTHLVRVRNLARDNNTRLAQSAAEHELIAQAIANGDQDLAAHANHVHLHNAFESILHALDESKS